MPAVFFSVSFCLFCFSVAVFCLSVLRFLRLSSDGCRHSLEPPPSPSTALSHRSLAPWLRLWPTMASSKPAAMTMTPRRARGKRPSRSRSVGPHSRPSTSLNRPSRMMLAPLRAPKRYCAANPPAPWQTGTATLGDQYFHDRQQTSMMGLEGFLYVHANRSMTHLGEARRGRLIDKTLCCLLAPILLRTKFFRPTLKPSAVSSWVGSPGISSSARAAAATT